MSFPSCVQYDYESPFATIYHYLRFEILASSFVATLAFDTQPRQGLARLRAKRETQKSHHMLPGVQKVQRV
jgi:hypothetical protein